MPKSYLKTFYRIPMEGRQSTDYLNIFLDALKNSPLEIDKEDSEKALKSLIASSGIKDFNEYIRSYKYNEEREKGVKFYLSKKDQEEVVENFRYRKYMELFGHTGEVERLAFDNGCKFIFSASADGTIKIWNVKNGMLVYSLIGHRSFVGELCFSKNGRLLVSCDTHGVMIIWDLLELKILFKFRYENDIIFAEFFEEPMENEDCGIYHLVVVASRNIVKTIKFNLDQIEEENENNFTSQEPVKAICISDGGRFLLRGGCWPYLLMIDTLNIDKCIILETNNLSVNTICAAKNRFKFAAACENLIFQWTYYVDGEPSMGNFKKKSSSELKGYWKKFVFKIGTEDFITTERICFLPNNYLVCVCSDFKVRIYRDNILEYTVEITEMGLVCAHPKKDIFALCGTSISFYYLNQLISSEPINFNITEFQFSDNGNYFIAGDDFGKIRIYHITGEYQGTKEQFFPSDFKHIYSLNTDVYMPCDNSYTCNFNRELNNFWKPSKYSISGLKDKENRLIEEFASLYFKNNMLDFQKYIKKYRSYSCTDSSHNNDDSSDEVSSSDVETSSEEFTSTSEEQSDNNDTPILRRTASLLTSSSEDDEVVNVRRSYSNRDSTYSVPLRRTVNSTSSSNDVDNVEYSGRKRRRAAAIGGDIDINAENNDLFRRLRRHQR